MNHSKQLLFLCTGNYYRSRFAEIFFNALVKSGPIGWMAVSCGLRLSRNNIGRISRYALLGLDERGIFVPNPQPFPKSLTEADLKAASLIIAVKEAEHRPLMHKKFPHWEDQVLYWNVHDLDKATPQQTFDMLEKQVRATYTHLAIQGAELSL